MRASFMALLMCSGCFEPVCEWTDSSCYDRPPEGRPTDAGPRDAGSRDAVVPDASISDAGRTGPVGSYEVVFVCTVSCSGTYVHRMTITQSDPTTGAFSGTGFYTTDLTYTWTATGKISGQSVDWSLVYTGTNAGYRAHMTGSVDSTGSLSTGIGTSSQSQTYTWNATRSP